MLHVDAPAPVKTVHIETFGCQMNALDSELVLAQLKREGFVVASEMASADVVLINTCSVRALSEQKVWSMLGRLARNQKDHPHRRIGVMGCMAERQAQILAKRMPHVDVICGPSRLDALPALLEARQRTGVTQVAVSGHNSRRSSTQALAADAHLEALDQRRSWSGPTDAAPTMLDDGDSPFQAYVRITRGCNKFCSFCIVPFVRGPESHRAPDQIVAEVRRLVDEGVREVTLLGQTVNHYVYRDGGRTTSFADLLVRVHDEVPQLARLRFLTSYPRDFGDDALDAMAHCERICRFLHIPAQSGSNRMLRKMNRGYTVEAYESLLQRARAKMPDIRIAGDMIVGYPSETEEDHVMSEQLLRRAQLKSCFIFKYSPREGTVAAKRHTDDVSEDLKKARHQRLLALQQEISKHVYQQRLHQPIEVLVEQQATTPGPFETDLVRIGAHRPLRRLLGRTSGDEVVTFLGSETSVGQLVHVKITAADALTLQGQLL